MITIQEVYPIKTIDDCISHITEKQRNQLNLNDEESTEIMEIVVIHMLINNNEYKLIHAFPGDNPVGLLFNDHESWEFNETQYDHLADQKDQNVIEFLTWYKEMTEDFMNFERFQSLYKIV
jgi:hypothetical protein